MLISTSNPAFETILFELLLVGAILFSVRRKTATGLSADVTSSVKGVAILAVVLSHIGYFLVTDHAFLQPLSNYAGVGVDTFLVLSGFGLTLSMMKKRQSPLEFYRRRVSKLFIPWWICLVLFLALDALLLRRYYPFAEMWRAVLGIFPRADLYHNFDSPLWYFSFIFSYYIFFPLIFWKRFPTLSAAFLYLLYRFVLLTHLPAGIDQGVAHLYELHFVGFPLGMVLAHMVSVPRLQKWWGSVMRRASGFLSNVPVRTVLALGGIYFLWYLGGHSWVGKGTMPEQYGSLFTVAVLLVTFLILPYESRLLRLLGEYSYEIYLLHWPLVYRFGFLYILTSVGLATAGSLVLSLGLSGVLRLCAQALEGRLFRAKARPVSVGAASATSQHTTAHS